MNFRINYSFSVCIRKYINTLKWVSMGRAIRDEGQMNQNKIKKNWKEWWQCMMNATLSTYITIKDKKIWEKK